MSNEQKINELAETLKSKGLACSMADALEKAKCILEGIANPTPEKKVNSDDEANKKALEDLKRRAIESTKQQTNSIIEPKIIETNTQDPRIDEINKEVDMLEAKKDPSQIKLEENYDIMQDDRTLGEIMKEAKQEEEEERANESYKETDEYSEENDSFLQKSEEQSIVLQETEEQSIVLQETEESEPVLQETEEQSIVLQETEESEPVLQETEESEPVLQETEEHSRLPSIDDIDDVSNNNIESDFITTKDEEEPSSSYKEEENNKVNFTQGLMEEEPSSSYPDENNKSEKTLENNTEEKEKPTLTEEEKEAADLSKIFNVNK